MKNLFFLWNSAKVSTLAMNWGRSAEIVWGSGGMGNFYLMNEINQFLFLTNRRGLNRCNYVGINLFLKFVLVEMKGLVSQFNARCLGLNLDIFYLIGFNWFIISITPEHTCSKADEIENGYQQIRQWCG